MNRVLISVEGQTEETFVREVLLQHLIRFNILVESRLVATKRVKHGPVFKGGIFSYQKVREEIRRLFLDQNIVAVSTMYDLSGLPPDFPGYATRPKQDPYAKVEHLEFALRQDIDNHRFRPYLQLHEFEALLFADPARTAAQFPGNDRLKELQTIRDAFVSPEEINDGVDTAPSKRLLSLYRNYQKPIHGPLATIEIGLEILRRECAHFRGWLEWLESLG